MNATTPGPVLVMLIFSLVSLCPVVLPKALCIPSCPCKPLWREGLAAVLPSVRHQSLLEPVKQPASSRSAVWTGCPCRAAKLGSYWVDPESYKIWKEIKRGQKAAAPWEQGRRHICGLFWGPLLRTETNSSISSFPSSGRTSAGCPGHWHHLWRGSITSLPSAGRALPKSSCSIRAHRDPVALQEGTPVLVTGVLLQPCPSHSSTAALSAFEHHQLHKTLPGTILRPKPVWNLISGPQRGPGLVHKSWLSSAARQQPSQTPWSMCWCEGHCPLPPPRAPLCPWPAEAMAVRELDLALHSGCILNFPKVFLSIPAFKQTVGRPISVESTGETSAGMASATERWQVTKKNPQINILKFCMD